MSESAKSAILAAAACAVGFAVLWGLVELVFAMTNPRSPW